MNNRNLWLLTLSQVFGFTVFSTQAVGALSAGYFLNMVSWQTINLICLPFLAIIALVIWSADRMETSKNL